MVGNRLHQRPIDEFKDPFNAGQMVGMLVMLSIIEKNNGITESSLQEIKSITANNLQVFFNKPTEDIFLMINDIVKRIGDL